MIGGLVMGVLNNGMSILGVGTDWQQVDQGPGAAGRRRLRHLNKKRTAGGGGAGAEKAEATAPPQPSSIEELEQLESEPPAVR